MFALLLIGFCGKLSQNENKEKIIIFHEKCENIFYPLYRIGHHRPIIIIVKNEDANTTKDFYNVKSEINSNNERKKTFRLIISLKALSLRYH